MNRKNLITSSRSLVKSAVSSNTKRSVASTPYVSTNPTTGAHEKTYPFATRREVDALLDNSWKSFQEYRTTSFAQRADMLRNVAKNLLAKKQEYGKIITTEMGKPINSAIAEVEKCAHTCEYFAKEAEQYLADQVVPSDATESRIVLQPLGPILQAAPFNFPFWQVIRFAAPALMAGNTVIVRHSHSVPQSAEALEEVFAPSSTGLPQNAYKNSFMDNQCVARSIADMRIRGVTFTGSTQTGRIFAEMAAKNLKKHVLELGGNDPFIVLEDADLDLAAKTAVNARCFNNGQSCIASKRFIVVKSVVHEFTERLVTEFKKLKVGDPMDPTVQIGPLARKDLLDRVAAQVNMTISQGAQLLCGGYTPKGSGFFYAPTILGNVKRGMVSEEEEVFGPVASIIEAKDENEALEIANHSEFGLGATVMTRSEERAARFIRDIESGQVFVNGMTKSTPQLPFGGVKNSGYGRELGRYGILEFVNVKTIWKKF